MKRLKDAKRAVLIAKRIHKQEGGSLGYPSLMGEPVEEHTTEMDNGTKMRAFKPIAAGPPRNPALPVLSNQPPPRMVKPVMESLTHKLIADPAALQGMKAAVPQKWRNALAGAGVKKEELDLFGIGGNGNHKLTRDDIAHMASSKMPKIRPRLLGDTGTYQELISGDPDAEPPQPPDINTRWGDWEQDEPDSYHMDERARENGNQQIEEEYEDPEFSGPYMEEALHDFKKHWLHDTPPPNDDRARQFAMEAIENGWVSPNDAAPLARQRHISDDDWQHFTNKVTKGVHAKFGEHEEDSSHLQDALPGMMQHAPPMGLKTQTSEWLKPFGDAVRRLHGFNTDQYSNFHNTDEDVGTAANLPRNYSGHHAAPDINEHVKEHIAEDSDFQQKHRDQAEEDYRNDDEAPSTTTVTAEGADGDPDYTVHQAYGEYSVRDPHGRHIGDYSRWNRADDAIMEHARENYPGEPEEGGYEQPVYETRHIPRDNINLPDVEGGRRYASAEWNLPGLESRREIPIEFTPPEGQPQYMPPHYGDNTLGHMRVGDWHTPEGKRILHIDELQSDLHQAGAKQGYFNPENANKLAEKEKETAGQYAEARRKIKEAFPEMPLRTFGHLDNDPDLSNSEEHRVIDELAGAMAGSHDYNTAAWDDTDGLKNALRRWSPAEEGKILGLDPDRGHNFVDKWDALHARAKERLGENYKDIARAVSDKRNELWEAQREKNKARRGIPDMPWKDTGDFGRMMMRVALRHAAEYGYDGISLSPGFIQTNRWGGNNHNHLYDNIFGGALEGVAKEAKRFAGADLKVEKIVNPHVREKAKRINAADSSGNVKAILFHHPEDAEKIKSNSLPAFKRGGVVKGTKKDIRRAIMIAGRYAAGGEVPPELNSMGMYSAATEAAKNMGQARGPKDQMYRTLQKGQNVRQDELDYSGVKDWMDQQPGNQVHKDQIADYLRGKQMPITDVISDDDTGDTKFGPNSDIGGQPLPGGTNYKELRMVLPKNADDSKNFYSPNEHHHREPNIVAHARFDDRMTPDGKKILHVAEVQSDWAKEIQRVAEKEAGEGAAPEKINALKRDPDFLKKHGLPPHPMPNNWHELAMKRLLAHAGQNGYDGISWDTGDTQADRYDLRKQVSAIHYKNNNGRYNVSYTPQQGQRGAGVEHKLFHGVDHDTVSKVFAHDISNKMKNGVGTPDGDRMKLQGEDLKIGTEGMKAFYDGIIKSYMNRLSQKRRWGARAEYGPMGNNRAHIMMFPDEMKADLQRGLPMQRGGRVRRGFADGGTPVGDQGSFTQPVLNQGATEAHIQSPQGQTYRKFFTDPHFESDLPEGSKVIKSEPVAPLFHSNTVKALSGDAIPMKNGSIQQWINKLKDKGAKDWEIKRMGLHTMDPKMQIAKEDLLQRAHDTAPQMGMTWLGSDQHTMLLPDRLEPQLSSTVSDWRKAPADSSWLRAAKLRHEAELKANPYHDPADVEDVRADAAYYAKDRLQHMKIGAADSYSQSQFLNPRTPGWTEERTRRDAPREGDVFRGRPATAIDHDRAAQFVKTAVERGWAAPETAQDLLPSLMAGHINAHAWNDFLDKLPDTATRAFMARGTSHDPELPGITIDGEDALAKEKKVLPAVREATLFDKALNNIHRGENPDYFEKIGDSINRLLRSKRAKMADRLAQAEHEARPDAPMQATGSVAEGNTGSIYSDYMLRTNPGHGNKIEVRSPYAYSHDAPIATVDTLEEAKAEMMRHAIASGGIRMPDQPQVMHNVPEGNIEAPTVTHGNDPHGQINWHIPEMKNYRAQTFQFKPEIGEYRAGHYGPRYMGNSPLPNTVWHVRGGDLPDAQGRNFYVHDETQDDWGRDIHKAGGETLSPETASEIAAARQQQENIGKKTDLARDALKTLYPQHGFRDGAGWDNTTIHSLARILTHPNDIATTAHDFQRLNSDVSTRQVSTLLHPDLDESNDYLGDIAYDSKKQKNYTDRLQASLYHRLRQLPDRQALNLMKTLKEAGSSVGEHERLYDLISKKSRALPDRPWQKTSEMARLAIWAGLRHAADYGHEGYAMMPGWVHYKRWANQEHHLPLYDNIYADTLKKIANELKVPAERIHFPALGRLAKSKGYRPEEDPRLTNEKLLGKGRTIPDYQTGYGITLTPELRHYIRTNSRGLKTGGRAVEDALRVTQKYLARQRAPMYKSSN